MKKVVFFIFLVSQFVFSQTQSNSQSHFNNAAILYNKANYKAAAELYETIIQDNKETSEEVYFNLGNCYYQLDKIAPAIYNYEKALQINPTSEKILTNLELAQNKTIDKIKVIQKSGVSKLVNNIINLFHYDTWAWLAVFFGFGCTLFFSLYYFSNTSSLKRIFFGLLLVSLFFCLLSVVFGFSQKETIESKTAAIVFATATEAKQAPRSNSKTIMTLHEGTKVFIIATEGKWFQVQLTDNSEVWIEKEAVIELR